MIVYCEVQSYDMHFYATLVRDEKRVTLKYYLSRTVFGHDLHGPTCFLTVNPITGE